MKKKIAKEIIGKTVKEVELTSGDDPSVVLTFTDGTTFYVLNSSTPRMELLFTFSDADGDELHQELGEK